MKAIKRLLLIILFLIATINTVHGSCPVPAALSSNITIRKATENDLLCKSFCNNIYNLYKEVTTHSLNDNPGTAGLARTPDEITYEYIHGIACKAISTGLMIIAEDTTTKNIVGLSFASRLEPKAFSHMLTDASTLVHPKYRGKGIVHPTESIATRLRTTFFIELPSDIERVELFVRESNTIAISLNEKFGFKKEARLANRIRAKNGTLEADWIMTWVRKPE